MFVIILYSIIYLIYLTFFKIYINVLIIKIPLLFQNKSTCTKGVHDNTIENTHEPYIYTYLPPELLMLLRTGVLLF